MRKIIFISAIRSLLKFKHISIINMLGLVLGLTSFLFIQHYLLFEYSYDGFVPEPDNVYRVNLKVDKEGQTIYNGAKTPRALYFSLKNSIPEVESNGIAYFEKCLINYKQTTFSNEDVLWVDEGFEKVFPLTMVDGVADYSKPRTGIISETAAQVFFKSENPIGKILRVNEGMPIEITGIYKDLPSNTHLKARYFASIKTWVEMGAVGQTGDWQWNGWWNYIRLKNGVSVVQTEQKLNEYIKPHMAFITENGRNFHYSLQPLTDLHFLSGLEGELGAQTNRSSLQNLVAVVLVLMLIVWINYINLAAAHAQARSQPIKMRKLVGATNFHLWMQSLAECIILNLGAVIISTGLYLGFLKLFASLFSIPVANAIIPFRYLILSLLATLLIGILFTSIYNMFTLSGISILPSKNLTGKRNYKSPLVILQMSLSIVFLACTILVFKQISYMKNKDLGIKLDQVAILTGPASLNSDGHKRERFEAFKQELMSNPDFAGVTFNMYVPGQEPRYGFKEFINPAAGQNPDVLFFENNAGEGFIETYKMELLAGHDFGLTRESNQNRVIINQSSLRYLGFDEPEKALGKTIFRRSNDSHPLEIIGVVADFHNEGLQKPIYPMVYNNTYPSEFGFFAIRINSANTERAIEKLNTVWDKHYPNDNFHFVFADDQFNSQYSSESRFGKFFLWLTLLSIIIASMGLYGLVLFIFAKRTKEIGIRKTNGARVFQIVQMLNLEYVVLVTIAFLLATPVAYFIMKSWLNGFAYKTTISWWVFVLSGIITMGIALLTVSFQSWKAATRNPVEALRYE